MTKKDYEAFAFAFGHAYADTNDTEGRGVDAALTLVEDGLKRDNSRFNSTRFRERIDAIRIKCTGGGR
jgi:hypothetical protein